MIGDFLSGSTTSVSGIFSARKSAWPIPSAAGSDPARKLTGMSRRPRSLEQHGANLPPANTGPTPSCSGVPRHGGGLPVKFLTTPAATAVLKAKGSEPG